jgi:hypothetical protein
MAGPAGQGGPRMMSMARSAKSPSETAARKKAPQKKKETAATSDEEAFVAAEGNAEESPISRNPARCRMLRELWFDEVCKVADKAQGSFSDKQEVLFMNLANSILDMVIDIVPEEYGRVIAENMDDYLAIAIVNKKFKVNLLQKFRDDFVESKGIDFTDEDDLMQALQSYQEEWWNGKRKDLKGRSPNEALLEASTKYGLS